MNNIIFTFAAFSNISSEEMFQNKRNTQGWYEYNSLKHSILQPFQ